MDYKIKDLYEEMELELIASMKRNLKRHLNEEKKVGFEFTQWQAEKLKELKRYQRENAKIIGRKTKGLNKKVSEHLQKELKQGSINAIRQYNKLHKDKFNADKLLNKSFFQTNDAKVNNLIKVVNNDLNIVKASALRMTNDQYREVIHKSAFFNANGVMTEKQAVDMANKDFLSRGLNCIEYKDGRRVNIASYSQMAVRTASLRAHLMGEGDFRKEIGNPLVIVTTHGTACKLCTAWQGKILIDDVYSGGTQEDGNYTLLSEAMKQGFLHPNCRHGLATYYPELEGIKYDEEETDEEIDDALRDKLNYYDRQEQANIRKSKGFIDRDNVKSAKKEIIACEKKKDELLIKYDMSRYKDYSRAIEKGYWDGNMKHCNDITKDWLGIKKKKVNNVIKPENYSYVKYKGKKYFIDNNHVKIDFKNGEEDLADAISNLTDKRIELFPRFDYFKSTDAKIGREYVDFKITTSGTDKFIYNNITEAKGQSKNFIFWIKNKDIPEDVINYQIDNFFRRNKEIKIIGYYKNNQLFIYKKK